MPIKTVVQGSTVTCFLGLWILLLLNHFKRVLFFMTLWTVAFQAPVSMEILQEKMLEWVAMPSFRGSSRPRDRTSVSYISCSGRQVLVIWEALPGYKIKCNALLLNAVEKIWGQWFPTFLASGILCTQKFIEDLPELLHVWIISTSIYWLKSKTKKLFKMTKFTSAFFNWSMMSLYFMSPLAEATEPL